MKAAKAKRAAIYARVSTKEQQPRTQLRELRTYAKRRGFTVAHELIDLESGAKDDRPNLRRLLELARGREIDVVLVWKFDRFARSSLQLITSLNEFRNMDVDFISYTEQIDTTAPWGKMVFTVFAGIAEFERDLIRQRVLAGLARAREDGRRLGRPPLDAQLVAQLRSLRQQGLSVRTIAAKTSVSVGVVDKYSRVPSRPKPRRRPPLNQRRRARA